MPLHVHIAFMFPSNSFYILLIYYMSVLDYAQQVGISHYNDVCYEGCLTKFKIGDEEEASKLYPEVKYTTVEDYLKRYV